MKVICNNNTKKYLVYGKHIDLGPSLFQRTPLSIYGVYEAINEDEAYKMFLTLHCPNVRDAQRFYNTIGVVELNDITKQFLLSDTFGKFAKFPNPDLFTDDDLYF